MNKIKNYVDDLFKDIRKTRKSEELKEELLSDLEEKYQDLIANGKNEKEAYQEVIGGIGDVDELLEELKEPTQDLETRKKTAFVVSLSVGLYILALISTIICDELLELPDTISAVSFFGIAGIATCILIYHFMSIPKYQKMDDSFVEIRKEKIDARNKNKQLLSALDTIVWLLILIIYFLISFLFDCWYISWILFLVGPLVTTIVHLLVGGDE
ncbi:MAG: hypothetical protein HFH08_01870 [Bacilli bacterium]|nr:hypothetical protein [Bacilli bacterium]